MRKHWEVTGKQEYFHVTGLEIPTLLVDIAKWLLETNVAVDHIVFESQYTDDALEGDNYYVSATVSHSSTMTKGYDDPFEEEGIVVDGGELLELLQTAIEEVFTEEGLVNG